jgi:hypothetical protein
MITAVKSVRRQVSRDALVTRSHNLEKKKQIRRRLETANG